MADSTVLHQSKCQLEFLGKTGSTSNRMQILGARHLVKTGRGIASPFVEMEIAGIKCDNHKFKTGTKVDNGLNPVWNESCVFDVLCPDTALIRFAVMDEDIFGEPNFLGQACFPVLCIRSGYRSVLLKNGYSEPLELASLLVHIDMRNHKLKWPAEEEGLSADYLFCCGGRTFIVAHSVKEHMEDQPFEVQLLEVDRVSGELSVKCSLFVMSFDTLIRAFYRQGDGTTGNILFVLGLETGLVDSSFKFAKLVTYDIDLEKKECWESPFETFTYLTFTYLVSEGLVATKLEEQTSHLFSLRERRWMASPRHAVDLPPVHPAREDFATAAVNDEIYLFGGKEPDAEDPVASVVKFSLATRTWTELNPLPVPLMDAGVAVGCLPADVLRCHIDCPHCVFHCPRSRTIYNVIPPRRLQLDDDDDDGSTGFSVLNESS